MLLLLLAHDNRHPGNEFRSFWNYLMGFHNLLTQDTSKVCIKGKQRSPLILDILLEAKIQLSLSSLIASGGKGVGL